MQQNKGVVISYWSRQLTRAERNYSAIEHEALAAVCTIKEFYPYVYGFPFKLITNHNLLISLCSLKNVGGLNHNLLISLCSLKNVGGRLSRWIMYLQQFNFEVEYRAGKDHTNADALSHLLPSSVVMPVMEYHLGDTAVDVMLAQQAD